LANPLGLTSYFWNVPDGVEIVYGQGTSVVQLFFSQTAPNPSHISLTGANGCGNGSTPLDVTVHPSYMNIVHDTVCSGETYSQYGFDLGVLNEAGNFVHTRTESSAFGCENVDILLLFVSETPPLSVLADPQELCLGETTELHAAGSQSSVTLLSQLPKVWVGDILCTDNSFVHPQDWPCDKTAMGVVFYVDSTGKHGWAVNLQDEPNTYSWGIISTSLENPALTYYNYGRFAMEDMNGLTNTFVIRQNGNSNDFPAAYAVDFDQGWYLPASGQAYHLYAELPRVNSSLQLAGGTPFPMNSSWVYWTSTMNFINHAWVLDNQHGLNYSEMNYPHLVRSVRSF
jgi:hypothetical protein